MKIFHLTLAIAGVLLLSACARQPETIATTRGSRDIAPVAGQQNPGIQYGGGDGLSIATAVVILHAKGEDDGVRAEYHWIATHHPGWKTQGQALLQGKKGLYDKIICVKPDGKTVNVFFEISGFFGKY